MGFGCIVHLELQLEMVWEHAWQGARCKFYHQACSSLQKLEGLETTSKDELLCFPHKQMCPGSRLALVETVLLDNFSAQRNIGVGVALSLVSPLKRGSCIGGLLYMSGYLQNCLVP